MVITELTDLKAFYDFLGQKVQRKEKITPEQAIAEWLEHVSTVESIQRGIEDANAGRTRPASEVIQELRERRSH